MAYIYTVVSLHLIIFKQFVTQRHPETHVYNADLSIVNNFLTRDKIEANSSVTVAHVGK